MLTSQQAQWLVTFYRNLPANRPQMAAAQQVQSEVHQAEVVNGERYPYFDLRQMTR